MGENTVNFGCAAIAANYATIKVAGGIYTGNWPDAADWLCNEPDQLWPETAGDWTGAKGGAVHGHQRAADDFDGGLDQWRDCRAGGCLGDTWNPGAVEFADLRTGLRLFWNCG